MTRLNRVTNETTESVLIIEAGLASRNYWSEAWQYRELFFFLAWRDIIIRYKQTLIGVAWSVIRPLVTMVIFTLIFGKLANLPSDGTPYPVLVFCALLPWQFFTNVLTSVGGSLIGNSHLISKVYFPRIIIPSSALIVNSVDFLISFIMLTIIMIAYDSVPSINIIFLPFFIVTCCMASFGLGLIIASLNVRYRDFAYVVPFILQAGLYISPVGFSSSIVPADWRFIYSLNPIVGVIDGFRWSIAGGASKLYWPATVSAFIISFMLFLIGFRIFRKTEKSFADII